MVNRSPVDSIRSDLGGARGFEGDFFIGLDAFFTAFFTFAAGGVGLGSGSGLKVGTSAAVSSGGSADSVTSWDDCTETVAFVDSEIKN